MARFEDFLEDIQKIIDFYNKDGKIPTKGDMQVVYLRSTRGKWRKYVEGWTDMRCMALGNMVFDNYYHRNGGGRKHNPNRKKVIDFVKNAKNRFKTGHVANATKLSRGTCLKYLRDIQELECRIIIKTREYWWYKIEA